MRVKDEERRATRSEWSWNVRIVIEMILMNGVLNENLGRNEKESESWPIEGAFEWRVSYRGDMDMSSAD